jgi:hypothetical protein
MIVVQLSAVMHTSDGHKLDNDYLAIFTVVEEDGQLKISELKVFIDPEQRRKLFSWGANALAKGVPAA